MPDPNLAGPENGPRSGESTLSVRNLTKSWPKSDVVVFRGLSLEIRLGEITCLIGPSGCGKTTLMMCIAGLEDYTGEISRGVVRLSKPGPDRIVVFQNYALVPWRTVGQNITLGLELRANFKSRRERLETARRLIALTGLTGFERALPHQLSGGMQQRVAIARALAIDPDILLMDEPFGALDALTRRKMGLELISIWRATNKTIIFVTHSVEEALTIGDRVIVFSERPMTSILDLRLDTPRTGRLTDEVVGANQRILQALGMLPGR